MRDNDSIVTDILEKNIRLLSDVSEKEIKMNPDNSGSLPSINNLKEIMGIIKVLVFPDFFDRRRNCPTLRPAIISVNIEKLYNILNEEILKAYTFSNDNAKVRNRATEVTLEFINRLPEIKDVIYTDVEAVFENDPAVHNYGEIILCYPAILAILYYRVAHELLLSGVPVLPRMITELAHSITGIDINPGAVIGKYFAIDHGTGVVIGETCIIGNNVTIYQGVTLGAKNFTLDSSGRPVNIPRHPVIEDNVTIYSNTTVLGRITIGHDSVIGGNVWLTESVPPQSRVIQPKAKNLCKTKIIK